jgi:hypothetical protein
MSGEAKIAGKGSRNEDVRRVLAPTRSTWLRKAVIVTAGSILPCGRSRGWQRDFVYSHSWRFSQLYSKPHWQKFEIPELSSRDG